MPVAMVMFFPPSNGLSGQMQSGLFQVPVIIRSNQGRFASAGAIAKTESDCDKPDDGIRIHRREQVAEMSDWVD
nr:hypothetical protein [Fibrobacter sp. UWB10]